MYMAVEEKISEEIKRCYDPKHPSKVQFKGIATKRAKYLAARKSIDRSNRPEVDARVKAMKGACDALRRFWTAEGGQRTKELVYQCYLQNAGLSGMTAMVLVLQGGDF